MAGNYQRIRLIDSVKDRIEFVVNFVYETTSLQIREYLGKIATFDMLILNTDRHFNNLGIVADLAKGQYKTAPAFDHGNALLSNLSEFPMDDAMEENIDRVVGQPFSASLESQAMELGFGLKVDYAALDTMLQREPDSRALGTLRFQLKKYEAIIKQ